MKNKILVLLLTTITASSMVQAHFGDDNRGFGAFLGNTIEAPFDTTEAVFHEGPYVYPDDYRYPRRDQDYRNDSRRSNREIQRDIDRIRKQARRERRELRDDERADIARLERQMNRR